MTLFSIILVNYNNSTDTINCLKQLNKQYFKNFEVIIVDNNSNKNSIENLNSFLKKFQEQKSFKLYIYYQGINNGYSGGINYGIKRSVGGIILILNSDIIIDNYFLKKAVHLLESNLNYAIMGPKIYYFPNKQKIWFTGGYFKFINYRGVYELGRGLLDLKNNILKKSQEVDYVSGCCMFVRREVFKKVKLFDKNFFMYSEDSDFCYRARKLGYKVIYFPDIILFHKIDEIKESYSEFVKYYYFKNKFLFILKHYPFILILYQFLISTFMFPIIIFKNKRNKNRNIRFFLKNLKAIIEGISLGIIIRFF